MNDNHWSILEKICRLTDGESVGNMHVKVNRTPLMTLYNILSFDLDIYKSEIKGWYQETYNGSGPIHYINNASMMNFNSICPFCGNKVKFNGVTSNLWGKIFPKRLESVLGVCRQIVKSLTAWNNKLSCWAE